MARVKAFRLIRASARSKGSGMFYTAIEIELTEAMT